MGDRASIIITSKYMERPIQLYGHWSGEDNIEAVRNVLARTQRVGDSGYLIAELFYEFAVNLGKYEGKDGNFGVYVIPEGSSLYMGWEDNPTITVDADTGLYTVERVED